MSRAKGFTLIELMIVVSIIGVLAAIAIPNFMSSRSRAMEASVRANMHSVHVCVEDFSIMAEGYYPGTIDTKVGDVLTVLGYVLPGGWASMKPFAHSLADGRRHPPFTEYALLHPHTSFHNPFKMSENAIDNSPGPPATPPSGCTYYTGYDETGVKGDGQMALGYTVFGYGRRAPILILLTPGH
jgi:prepilin-type N-terminal cleavage/methylation domain-containing protein